MKGDRILKRKVIYVYEKAPSSSNLAKTGSQILLKDTV